MDEQMTELTDSQRSGRPDSREQLDENDVQGSLYEFYLLLQRLKAGGISFDTFIERATTWATLRAAHDASPITEPNTH